MRRVPQPPTLSTREPEPYLDRQDHLDYLAPNLKEVRHRPVAGAVTHARVRHLPPGEQVIIKFQRRRAERRRSTLPRLDTLAVEAALNGRRSYWTLTAAEVAEVLRILRRRGSSLDFASWLLDVDRHVIAERYAAAGEAR